MSDLRQIDFKSWRKINPIEDWMENEQGKKKKVADSIIPPPTPNMSGSVLKKKKEMFAEKLFWLSWFYSKVLISSIICVFFRASCQSCRHPQPWMASFIVRMSWPGRLCCWVWLLCDILKFLNTLHKIFYCLIQLKLQNVSPTVNLHLTLLYSLYLTLMFFVNINVLMHQFASLFSSHPLLPPISLSTSGLEPYLWFLVQSQGWKGCSISLVRQVWISNGCQHGPFAR